MPSTADRLATLIADNFDLDHAPNFDSAFGDIGISSVDAIAFFKLVNDEFDLGLAPDDCKQFENLSALVAFIDSRAG